MYKTSLMIVLLVACSALFGFVSNPAQIDKPEQPPEERDWHAYIGDGQTTQDMVQRGHEAIKLLEPRMSEMLDALYTQMDEEGDALLRRSQDDWLKYTDSKIAFDRDANRGGSLSRIVATLSQVDAYCQRIKELRQAIEDRKPL